MTFIQSMAMVFSMMAFLFIGFIMGRCVVPTPTHPVEEERIKRKLLRRPSYDAGNLLDPISPADQKLERMLEMTAKEEARKRVQEEREDS